MNQISRGLRFFCEWDKDLKLDAKQRIIMSTWDEWSEELDLDIGNPCLVESLRKANHIKPHQTTAAAITVG
jgi:hypothetical protein